MVGTGPAPLVWGNGNGEAMVDDGVRDKRYAQWEERNQETT